MQNRACLVTGGAGFIGSHLVDRLLELGNKVIVIDNFSSGKEENLAQHKGDARLKVYNADICNQDIGKYFNGVSVVFHLAAIPRVQFSIKYPQIANNTNVTGTLNVLEACREAGVKRLIYSSSSSVYGDQDKLPFIETMMPNPMSPYALQKLVCEYYCRLYCQLYGLETVILRYFNIYGPRQDADSEYSCLIPRAIQAVLQNKGPVIFGDGEQTRDFTFVKDVVEANIISASISDKRCFGGVFNIGNGENLSVNFVVKTIIGSTMILPVHENPVIEPRNTLADISKSAEFLGWRPSYNLKQGINETIIFVQKHVDVK